MSTNLPTVVSSIRHVAMMESSTPNILPWHEFSFDNDSNSSAAVHFCKQILLEEINGRSVRIWDVAILCPNVLFLLFLMYKFQRIRSKLMSTNSPVFTAFYLLVYLITIVNVIRAIVSMALCAAEMDGVVVDKILWLVLDFFLVSAELSVLSFGLLFGHLDSRTSVRRVWIATLSISLVFTIAQSALEFYTYDANYSTTSNRIVLFSHGGIIYWLSTSAVLCLIYMIVCILPLTPARKKFILPAKRRFYFYCAFLALLNLVQVAGSGLISCGETVGMCVVCLTSYIYFAFYTPIVYFAFLRGYVTNTQTTLLFSYKPQKDENAAGAGEIAASSSYYPGFPGFTSQNYDDFLYNSESFYDSTDLNSPSANQMFDPLESAFQDNFGDDGHLIGRDGGVLVINADEENEIVHSQRSAIA